MIRTREEIEAELAGLYDDISNIHAAMGALEVVADLYDDISNINAFMGALEIEAECLLADIYCLENELAELDDEN